MLKVWLQSFKIMFKSIQLESQVYLLGILCPVIGAFFLLGQEIFDLLTGKRTNYDQNSTTVDLVLGLFILIDFGHIFVLHNSIQERNVPKFRLFWINHGILFVLCNFLQTLRYWQNSLRKIFNLSINYDISLFTFWWVFVLQVVVNFKFFEKLKLENGYPLTNKMLGIRIKPLLYTQIIVQWFHVAKMLYLGFLLLPGLPFVKSREAGNVLFWLFVIIYSFMAFNSILLFVGVKRERISLVGKYFILKLVLYIILSTIACSHDRLIRLSEPQLSWSIVLIAKSCRMALRLTFTLELCEIVYFKKLLKIGKQFSIEDITIANCSEEWHHQIRRMTKKAKISNWRVQYDTKMGFNKIAEGDFGNVYKGTFRKGCIGQNVVLVAVKVLKLDKNEAYMESILSELKTLLSVQNHPNLVKVFGIVLKKNQKGIIMEYCSLGSLDIYILNLRKKQEFPKNITKEHLQEFEKWATQIASAMDFIGMKHIIHADLSARNILLDGNRNAKITDFGMSLRLYNYQLYAESKSSVLPWRSMAPESLTDLQFSSKSDVWSYAVLLWEMYTFGEIPWEGFDWSSDFVDRLNLGVRLPKPEMASDFVYEYIMKRCWHLKPELRISFADIVKTFQSDQINQENTVEEQTDFAAKFAIRNNAK